MKAFDEDDLDALADDFAAAAAELEAVTAATERRLSGGELAIRLQIIELIIEAETCLRGPGEP